MKPLSTSPRDRDPDSEPETESVEVKTAGDFQAEIQKSKSKSHSSIRLYELIEWKAFRKIIRKTMNCYFQSCYAVNNQFKRILYSAKYLQIS